MFTVAVTGHYSGTHVKTKIDKILNESSGSLCRI